MAMLRLLTVWLSTEVVIVIVLCALGMMALTSDPASLLHHAAIP